MNDIFTVRIMSPKACVWETKNATALSAKNSEGAFDILSDHARFMSLIDNSPVSVELSDGAEKTFTFEHALLACSKNSVVIYTQEDLGSGE